MEKKIKSIKDVWFAAGKQGGFIGVFKAKFKAERAVKELWNYDEYSIKRVRIEMYEKSKNNVK